MYSLGNSSKKENSGLKMHDNLLDDEMEQDSFRISQPISMLQKSLNQTLQEMNFFEQQQIEEEEEYLLNIKQQRVKMQALQTEFKKKSKGYKHLASENKILQEQLQELIQYKSLYEQCSTQIEDLQQLVEKHQKQNEYFKTQVIEQNEQASLIDQLQNENKIQRYEVRNFKKEIQDMSQQILQKNEKMIQENQRFNTKEVEYQKMILQLQEENEVLQNAMKTFGQMQKAGLLLEKQVQKQKSVQKKQKQQNKELTTQQNNLQQKLMKEKNDSQLKQNKILGQFEILQKGYDEQQQVIQMKNQLLQDLQQKQISKTKVIGKLKKRKEEFKQKFNQTQSIKQKQEVQYNEAIVQLKEMQNALQYFKKENNNLKRDINYILEKQEEERIKRNEIELKKIELANERRKETEKINQMFAQMVPNSRGQQSPYKQLQSQL